MSGTSSFESDEESERKVRSIILAHLYMQKREKQDKVSFQEIEDIVSSMDQSYLKLDLGKLWNNSNLVKITDSNEFTITDEGMAEEEKRIKENRIID
ncbi:MAG: hypothetical protein AB7V56_00500 [Candidatus Nitrosocosmicus sp.]|jgi:hypothetical protein|uniref:hypothetical protein n=1 Tax=Candidatus Nitrosocosmicus agrestis TaxID=2563600 RepID=UPI00122DD9B3|nr:hypothetical protein [Candidatus Nitrosocosmicus sp. SS]KAA2282478.1 hypothetical protein F1Z66_06240 [Candidatus Nitrosocosmicus sp. SS]KAF0868744.1 hypothetical protein E5N71_08675 [Candidatus Nitrosocosmicus sp. SS]MDR4489668.1 hypothetical protein [Candidatus Nitrosocosmicus sp.]